MNLPFLSRFSRGECIGVDWGVKELKLARLQTLTPDKYKLTFLDSLEVRGDSDQIATQLKEYVSKNSLSGTKAAVSLQDESLHIRRLELPNMPEDDMKEAVRWQLRDVAEGSMDDYIVRHSVLKEETQGEAARFSLLGYCIKKTVIEDRIILLEKVGLRPFFLEPAAVSLAYAVERIYKTQEKEWIACLDLGWKRAYFLTLGQGKLHFVKSMGGVTVEQFELLKEEYAGKLALEIQRALDAFSITHQDAKIDKILVAGGGAGIPDLPQFLTKNLGVQTDIFNPLQGIEETHQFPIGLEKPYLFGTAIGLAFLKP